MLKTVQLLGHIENKTKLHVAIILSCNYVAMQSLEHVKN